MTSPPEPDRFGPLLDPTWCRDTKDPCPVFHEQEWHLFASGGSVVDESWRLLHATAPVIGGPWTDHGPIRLAGISSGRIAAPGVVHDGSSFHMFVQTDFLGVGGTLEHLVSDDGGSSFHQVDTALKAVAGSPEAGLFDAHPAIVDGARWLTYAAMADDLKALRWNWDREGPKARGPDLFAAVSTSGSWSGPWERRGLLLAQEDVPFHVRPGAPDYEWGLEGPQLLQLADGRVLLTTVCFVAGRRGTRQRVLWSLADKVDGPYWVLGPVLGPAGDSWESGEVGHGSTVVLDGAVWLFYQARSGTAGPEDEGEARWRIGVARWDPSVLDLTTGAP